MLNPRRGIIIARYKERRKELGTINYNPMRVSVKNNSFNLTEYFQIKKRTKEKKPSQKTIKKKIIIDKTIKEKDLRTIIPLKEDAELLDAELLDAELLDAEKKEKKEETLEDFVDTKKKKRKGIQ